MKIKIPAGIDHGQRLRVTGNGEAGIRGGPRGDLYVFVHVKEHDIFEREAENLYCEVPISYTCAALGSEIKIPTLDGHVSLKVPTGTQSGAVFKLRGKGMSLLNSAQRGDLMVRLIVAVPQKLTPEQRKKLEEYADLLGEDVPPPQKSFFQRAKEFFQ
jgi:molecular chaperone DnaJ